MTIKAKNSEVKRDVSGKFIIPPKSPGRPKKTDEDKIVEKAVKDWLKEHEEGLSEALPNVRPILIDLATKGNMQAIQEIHKVVGAHKKDDTPTMQINLIQIIERVNQVLDGNK